MGDPGPLDLILLQEGDNLEIIRAVRELELLRIARQAARRMMGRRYPVNVDEVALDALRLLFTSAIHTCNSIDGIRPLISTIATRQAINYLNEAFRRHWSQWENESQQEQPFEIAVEPGDDPLVEFRQFLAETLGHDENRTDWIADALIEGAKLTVLEQCLLREVILEGQTQREFSERYGIPLQGIGGHKARMLMKIRRFLARKARSNRDRS